MADNLFFLFSSLLISSSSVILLFVINSCVGGPGGATLGTVGSGGLGGVGWLPCAVARTTWLRRAVARAAAAPTRGDSGGGNSDAWRIGRRQLRCVATRAAAAARSRQAAFPALDPLEIGMNHLLLHAPPRRADARPAGWQPPRRSPSHLPISDSTRKCYARLHPDLIPYEENPLGLLDNCSIRFVRDIGTVCRYERKFIRKHQI
jgi:hypothetical protein